MKTYQKLKKNGLTRLLKIQLQQQISKIRGLLFSVHTFNFPPPKRLHIHSNVTSICRTLKIGNNVSIGANCSFGGLGEITLSDNVVLNRNVHMDSDTKIHIGENTLIGPDCYFVDSNHITSANGNLISSQITSTPILVGSNVWFGRGATILSGVKIGDNVDIGAGAVITKDIPSGVVVAGIPARIIKIK